MLVITPKVGVRSVPARLIPNRVIRQIEDLEAKLGVARALQLEPLVGRRVDADDAGPMSELRATVP